MKDEEFNYKSFGEAICILILAKALFVILATLVMLVNIILFR